MSTSPSIPSVSPSMRRSSFSSSIASSSSSPAASVEAGTNGLAAKGNGEIADMPKVERSESAEGGLEDRGLLVRRNGDGRSLLTREVTHWEFRRYRSGTSSSSASSALSAGTEVGLAEAGARDWSGRVGERVEAIRRERRVRPINPWNRTSLDDSYVSSRACGIHPASLDWTGNGDQAFGSSKHSPLDKVPCLMPSDKELVNRYHVGERDPSGDKYTVTHCRAQVSSRVPDKAARRETHGTGGSYSPNARTSTSAFHLRPTLSVTTW